MFLRLSHLITAVMLLVSSSFGLRQCIAATGESAAWSYRAWQTDEGLPDNSVTGVAQTSDGYLWVATYGGLLRFNGASFAAIPTPGVLKKSVCTTLLDRRGQLWLGIDSGSVICLERAAARAFGTVDGLPAERVLALAEDGQGAVWVIYSTALCCIRNGKVSDYTITEGLPAGANAWVASDSRGELWFCKGGQLGVVRDGKLLPKLKFDKTSIRFCGASSSGLWLCVANQVLKYQGGQEPKECALLPVEVEPQVLFEDRAGALWIGTVANGLFRFKAGELVKISTSHQSVNCVSEDREGNIWAGTRGGGLNLIRPSAVELIGRDAGLPFESVASVCEDAKGVLWAVGQSGVLARRKSGEWQVVGAEAGWTGGVATCVVADRQGGVWVGSRNRSLHYFRDGLWQVWAHTEGLHNGSVHLVFVAKNNDLWVVAGSPSRLQLLRDGKLSPPLELPPGSRSIRAIAESADGTLWAGTVEGQLLRINGSTLVNERAAKDPAGSPVRSLESTADGAVWIGYAGSGVGRFKDGKISLVTVAAGLMDDFPSQLMADAQDGMWIVGNHGLFRVQLAEMNAVADGNSERLRSLVFGRNEGLPNFQPNFANFPNMHKGRDGRLWFALRSGLLAVQPEKVRTNSIPPPVLLERVTVDDKTAALYDVNTPLQAESGKGLADLTGTNGVVRVPPGHRKIGIEFAALSYASPENVRFRYRLNGFDAEWIEAGTQRNAKYPHLPAGNYQFCVRACNNAGVWNDAGATLTLEVSPFFWQTWWFRGALLAIFTGMVVAVVRYVSFRRLRTRMQQLEQQAALDKERSRIARDMHDEVGAKLTRLSLLSEMAGGHPEIPPGVRGEVREISETARETIRSFEEIVWAVNPRNDTLADLVHYLCRYVEDYFEGSSVRCDYDLPPEIPPTALPTEVRHEVFLAAKESLNNVLKHAGAKQVRVQLVLMASEFKIVIEDDGRGFDTVAPPKRTGGGNGLENMRERLRAVGGRFECTSQMGKGTRIVFSAPR